MEIKNKYIALLYALVFTAIALSSANAAELERNTAQMQAMDKITGRVSNIEVPVGAEVEFRTFSIVVRSCYTKSAEEVPEDFAFVDVVDRPLKEEPVNIFKGWMLSSNPAINPVEHPIYDVWLLKCINTDIDKTTLLTKEQLAERDSIKSIQQPPEWEQNKILPIIDIKPDEYEESTSIQEEPETEKNNTVLEDITFAVSEDIETKNEDNSNEENFYNN